MEDQTTNEQPTTKPVDIYSKEHIETVMGHVAAVQAAVVERSATNREVADTALFLLSEALINMTPMDDIPTHLAGQISTEVMAHLRGVAMGLSHDIAASIEEVRKGLVDEAVEELQDTEAEEIN